MATDLTQQVEQEAQEISNALPVARGAAVQRCHFCGQLAPTATHVETVDGQERYKGSCCGG